MAHTVAAHFAKCEADVHATYAAILKAAQALGPVHEDPKKTSIHLVRERAFAGIATRKKALILTLKSERRVTSPRVHKVERMSANRWYFETRLSAPSEVDAELRAWLARAYELAS